MCTWRSHIHFRQKHFSTGFARSQELLIKVVDGHTHPCDFCLIIVCSSNTFESQMRHPPLLHFSPIVCRQSQPNPSDLGWPPQPSIPPWRHTPFSPCHVWTWCKLRKCSFTMYLWMCTVVTLLGLFQRMLVYFVLKHQGSYLKATF